MKTLKGFLLLTFHSPYNFSEALLVPLPGIEALLSISRKWATFFVLLWRNSSLHSSSQKRVPRLENWSWVSLDSMLNGNYMSVNILNRPSSPLRELLRSWFLIRVFNLSALVRSGDAKVLSSLSRHFKFFPLVSIVAIQDEELTTAIHNCLAAMIESLETFNLSASKNLMSNIWKS